MCMLGTCVRTYIFPTHSYNTHKYIFKIIIHVAVACDTDCSARYWLTGHSDSTKIIGHEGAGVAEKVQKPLIMRELRWHIDNWELASCGIEYCAGEDTFQGSTE